MANASQLNTKRDKKQGIRQTFSRHYYSLMPNKKHHRVLIWVVFLSVVITIGLQMAYPLNRAVPFARLGSEPVGWQTDLGLSTTVGKAFQDAKISLTTGSKKTNEVALVTTGAEPDTAKMVAALLDYPFWQRFIPGSILWQRPAVNSWRLEYASKALDQFATDQSKVLTFDAVNAKLEIKDGELVATNDAPGGRTSKDQIVKALQAAAAHYGGTIALAVPSTPVSPTKTAKDLADVRVAAETALKLSLTIQANGTSFTPSRADKAAWLQLGDDATTGATTLALNVDKLNAYIDGLSAKVGAPAGQTNVKIQDGQEIGRDIGANGSKINNQPLVDLIVGYLFHRQGVSPFIAEIVPVAPTIIYNNTYTATEAGLRAYIADKAKHGAWISIRQLDGAQWSADADATDSVVSGSTYKLYVALYLFKEMDEGKRDWSTPILDTDTTTCFDRMTIPSTNPCAEEWLRQFGRSNVNSYLYSRGFSTATTFTNPEAVHTSALDLTTYMIGLEQGTLMSSVHRDRLLYSLSHHPYRYGIPTGSKGQVWDKVGFVLNYVSDTAIVHHPKGTYVMTIMTQGQSYAAIAAMTKDIERIMYP